MRHRGVARARPGHLGGAGRAAALRVVQAHVLGGARPGGQAGRDPGRRRLASRPGGPPPRRSAPTSSSTASTTGACCASTTTPTRSTPPTCWRRIFGFLPGDDERLRASVLAIADELTEHGFVLRYRTDETDDGLTGKEGTFLICSFWLVSALAIIGEEQRARDLMERLLRVASPLGLYAEEFDTDTAHHLGNFPQAFSHLALIEAAARIILLERMREFDMTRPRLRRHHHRHGRRRRHARPPPGALGQAHPAARAGRLAAPGAGQLVDGRRVRRRPLHLGRHLVRPPTARRSSRRSTTSSAAPPSSTGPRCTGCGPRTSASCTHHDGLSPAWPISYDDMEPYYTQAEQLYQVHGARRRGPDRAAGERRLPVPGPPPRAPHPAARRRPRRRRATTRSTHPCGVMLDEANMPYSTCVRCGRCDGFPCPLHAKSDAEVLGVRPALEHPNVTLVTGANARRLVTDASGRTVTGVVVERDGETETVHGRRRRGVRAARPTRPSCCSRRPTTSTPTGLANGSDQVGRNYMFHNSQAVLALSKEPNPTVFQKTLGVNDFYFGADDFDVPDGQHPDGRQVRRRDVPGREADRDQAGADVRPARRSPSTPSTSGCRPRTCPGPTTGSPSARRDGDIRLAYEPTNQRRANGCTTSSSRCSATWACTPTT